MKVIVKARHMTLTPALRSFAEEKLGEAIGRIIDDPATRVEIELSDLGKVKGGPAKECRIHLSVPRGTPITICEVDDEMYKAINLAHDRLLAKLKREMGKMRDGARVRKQAAKSRSRTARVELTGEAEQWEREVSEYESSGMTP